MFSLSLCVGKPFCFSTGGHPKIKGMDNLQTNISDEPKARTKDESTPTRIQKLFEPRWVPHADKQTARTKNESTPTWIQKFFGSSWGSHAARQTARITDINKAPHQQADRTKHLAVIWILVGFCTLAFPSCLPGRSRPWPNARPLQ